MADCDSPITPLVARIVHLAGGRLDFRLRPGVTHDELAAVESEVGFALPDDVREFYLAHDGQERLAPGLLFGYPIDPLAGAVANWAVNKALAQGIDDQLTGDGDSRARQLALHDRWFPISSYQGADQLLIDTDPTDAGTTGQVIRGGHEIQDRRVIAPSFTALLTEVVDAFETNDVQVDNEGDQTVWGLAPGALAPWMAPVLPEEILESDARPPWLPAVDAAWRKWFDSKGSRFAWKFELARRVTRIPKGVSNLDPIANVRNLELLYLDGYPIRSLREIPESPTVCTLRLDGAESLDGIERFPALTSLFIQKSPGIDLTPLAAAPQLYNVHIDAPAVNHRALAGSRLTGIRTAARTLGDLDDILRLTTLHALSLDATGLDVGQSNLWPGMTHLFNLVLTGAGIDDLHFLARMPQLRTIELREMGGFSMSGIADRPLVKIVLADVADIRDLEELNSVAAGTRVAVLNGVWKEVL